MSTNYLINDPVPRNASKFPIHQTYLTDDAERTGTGGYKFKAPEVWSSARSGKKSIAVRSIERIMKPQFIAFTIEIHKAADNDDLSYDHFFDFAYIMEPSETIKDICTIIVNRFEAFAEENSLVTQIVLQYNTLTSELSLSFQHPSADYTDEDNEYNDYYQFRILEPEDEHNGRPQPSKSFYTLMNQPLNQTSDFIYILDLKNVWNRDRMIYFHASFIPFDNYQFLGKLNDVWQTPIIYQDPNTSPLFNIWVTTDLKTQVPILYESFIFRFTFIISSESHYQG